MTEGPVLEISDLRIGYRVQREYHDAVRGVSFTIGRDQAFGLVGESGCGKSSVALSVVRYLPENGRVLGGSIRLAGRDVFAMSDRELRRMRARTVSMVYQNPSTALNPSIRVGRQVAEAFRGSGLPRNESADRTLAMLKKVRISDPARVMQRYPHQLSGGMQQRIVIAMALATEPALLVLDEPTSSLDATVEAEVLDVISILRQEYGTSALFISHNLGVISRMCEQVGVMYAGRLVEVGPVETVLSSPRHPYTVGLLRCVPRWGSRKDEGALDTIPGLPPAIGSPLTGCVFANRCGLVIDRCRHEEPQLVDLGGGHFSRCFRYEEAALLPRIRPANPPSSAQMSDEHPILSVDKLSKTFQLTSRLTQVRALVDVTLQIRAGETLGLVGESGSGKSTLAKVLLGLYKPDAGSKMQFDERSLAAKVGKRSTEEIRAIQMVFQNPGASLNRRHSVRHIIGRATYKLLRLNKKQRSQRLLDLVDSVQLDRSFLNSKPGRLSGGLQQRVAIARAFAGDPQLVVCDEPTSALDVSVQAAILNLLVDLQRSNRASYLFISHDLGVVRYVADRIAVLYLGRLMELGTADQVFNGPHHPYTEALLAATPMLRGQRPTPIRLGGEIPNVSESITGCAFHSRCPRYLGEICQTKEPPLTETEPGHSIRCHIPVAELRQLQLGAGANGRLASPIKFAVGEQDSSQPN